MSAPRNPIRELGASIVAMAEAARIVEGRRTEFRVFNWINSDRRGRFDGSGGDPFVFDEGDRIEAVFARGNGWYGGKVTEVNDDGTYNIDYDDGDKERDVPADFVRRRARGMSSLIVLLNDGWRMATPGTLEMLVKIPPCEEQRKGSSSGVERRDVVLKREPL